MNLNSVFLDYACDLMTAMRSISQDLPSEQAGLRPYTALEGKQAARAFVGVSPLNSYFSETRLAQIFAWSYSRFEDVYNVMKALQNVGFTTGSTPSHHLYARD